MQREDNKRTPEQIAAKQRANKISHARRAKGNDRSTEKIAAAKAANDKRAKGINRSAVQVAAAKEANDERERAKGIERSAKQVAAAKAANSDRERAQGSDRSAQQVAAAKAANSDRERAQGSDRSSEQVAAVKKANKKISDARPPRNRHQERLDRYAKWTKFKGTRMACLVDDGIDLYRKCNFRDATSALEDAVKLIPDPSKYVHHELLTYFHAHYALGYCLNEFGDFEGAMASCHEALKYTAIHQKQRLKWTTECRIFKSQNPEPSCISRVKVCMC